MRSLILVSVVLAVSACGSGKTDGSSGSGTSAGSSTGAPQTCIPGQSVVCDGVKCTGTQTCLSDGSGYGACVCPMTTTSGSGTNGSTGGATGTSGGQTGGRTGSTGGSGTGATSSGTTTGAPRIGQTCSSKITCPDSQYCYPTSDGNGFCTIPCGEGAFEPPDGGSEFCAETPAVGGTPDCIPTFSTTNADAGLTFYCVLECGKLNGVDEGTCPPYLTCTENICE